MKTMVFNPYTGTARHSSDISSDPEGILLLDPDAPLRAATVEPAFWVTKNGAVHVNPKQALAHPQRIVTLTEVAKLRVAATPNHKQTND